MPTAARRKPARSAKGLHTLWSAARHDVGMRYPIAQFLRRPSGAQWVPGAVLSLAAMLVLSARIARTGEPELLFLVYNLALAWLPLVVAEGIAAVAGTRARVAVIPLGVAWLLLLPNAPYLVTDLIHLHDRPPVPMWYDVTLFLLFAVAGLVLGVSAVERVRDVARQIVGDRASRVLAVSAVAASGFGMYIGRFLRWNSWDVLSSPVALVHTSLSALAHVRPVGISALYDLVFAACYLGATLREPSCSSSSPCSRATATSPTRRPKGS